MSSRFRRLVLAGALLVPNVAVAEVIIPPEKDALLAGLVIPADAPKKGMWSKVGRWPIIGLHVAVMPSGAVMSYGTAIGNGAQDGRTIDIWTPEAGLTDGSHYTFANAEQVDSFCSTATYLTTGAMLISGGNSGTSGFSSLASTRFDSGRYMATAVASKLNHPRWYASMLTLTDGRALILGGVKPYNTGVYSDAARADVDGRVSNIPEVYSEADGWKTLAGAKSLDAFGATNNRWWYPRAWVGADGLVFGISSDRMWKLDPTGAGSIVWTAPFKTGPNETTRPNTGATSTAVMFAPGRILQVGGNGIYNAQPTTSSRQATVFDIDGETPTATDVTPMTFARQWANSTVLPNGRVLVTGGSTFGDKDGSNAVYPAETWDPKSGTWSVGASATVYRGYHSATVLLPNGTVLSTGGGTPGPVANFNAEVYYPPYLFRSSGSGAVLAPRPIIQSINALSFGHDDFIAVRSPQTAGIAGAALIGLSSTTHGFNTSQRYIPLRTVVAGDRVFAATPDAGLAIPGYYQFVLLDRSGVPSRAVIVSVGIANPKPQPPVASTRPVLPTDGAYRTFQSVNYPDRAVRHRNFLGWLEPVGPTSMPLAKADASFAVRPGLADPACYSLEAKNFANHFVRTDGGRIRLDRRPTSQSADFDLSATFCARRGFTGTDVSLEAKGKPGWFLRHRNFELWLDRFDGLKLFTRDATFRVIQAY
jgi:galactose oxidase